MTSSRTTSSASPFTVQLALQTRRTLEREVRSWELANPGGRSQLPDEVKAATEELAVHPFVGPAVDRRRPLYRKLHLRRTGFFIVYRVRPRLRVITIVALVPEASLAYRR